MAKRKIVWKGLCWSMALVSAAGLILSLIDGLSGMIGREGIGGFPISVVAFFLAAPVATVAYWRAQPDTGLHSWTIALRAAPHWLNISVVVAWLLFGALVIVAWVLVPMLPRHFMGIGVVRLDYLLLAPWSLTNLALCVSGARSA